jgi:hypothetical protein
MTNGGGNGAGIAFSQPRVLVWRHWMAREISTVFEKGIARFITFGFLGSRLKLFLVNQSI